MISESQEILKISNSQTKETTLTMKFKVGKFYILKDSVIMSKNADIFAL